VAVIAELSPIADRSRPASVQPGQWARRLPIAARSKRLSAVGVIRKSANTRVRVLDMLAANRIPLVAYHFPWPGVGHLAKNGEGFRYFPAALQMMELKA